MEHREATRQALDDRGTAHLVLGQTEIQQGDTSQHLPEKSQLLFQGQEHIKSGNALCTAARSDAGASHAPD